VLDEEGAIERGVAMRLVKAEREERLQVTWER
jgi:hypothetical protein